MIFLLCIKPRNIIIVSVFHQIYNVVPTDRRGRRSLRIIILFLHIYLILLNLYKKNQECGEYRKNCSDIRRADLFSLRIAYAGDRIDLSGFDIECRASVLVPDSADDIISEHVIGVECRTVKFNYKLGILSECI